MPRVFTLYNLPHGGTTPRALVTSDAGGRDCRGWYSVLRKEQREPAEKQARACLFVPSRRLVMEVARVECLSSS